LITSRPSLAYLKTHIFTRN